MLYPNALRASIIFSQYLMDFLKSNQHNRATALKSEVYVGMIEQFLIGKCHAR